MLFAVPPLAEHGGRGIRTPMGLLPADFKSAALPVRTSPPIIRGTPPFIQKVLNKTNTFWIPLIPTDFAQIRDLTAKSSILVNLVSS